MVTPHSGAVTKTTGTSASSESQAESGGSGGGGVSPPLSSSLSRSKKNAPSPLGDLLGILLDEADERLPPGFLSLDGIGRHLASIPGRAALVSELRARGFAACRCHLDAKAIRTDARMREILTACQEGLGIKIRVNSPFYIA